MLKKLFLFFTFFPVQIHMYGQCPTSDFNIAGDACLNEKLVLENNSTNSTTYFWDFCSGDFELTPSVESIGTSSYLNRSRSLKIVETSNGDWVGFSIDQANNRLVRFEFGNSLLNIPVIFNLGNPLLGLASAYDFEIIKESDVWYMFVINSTTNDLIKYTFGSDVLNTSPSLENLGDFGELNVPNGISLVNKSGNIFFFITNGGNNTVTRLEFGNSILSTPTANSFSIAGANNPRGIDIVKDCDGWYGLVTSYSNSKVYYLDFLNGIDQTPNTGEIAFYTSYNYPASVSIINEGGKYYSLIQSALGDLYKLSFGNSISTFTGTGMNLGDFGLASNFAINWVSTNSNWYGFSIELQNPSTPGAGNLIRYAFTTSCGIQVATSTDKYPSIQFTSDGTFQVTLSAFDANENINTASKSITISASEAPQLTSQITGNCLSSPINFEGQQLSGNINNWSWDFGDGMGTSMLQNDTYSYASAGTYQIKLNVTDVNGCSNLLIDTVQVYEEPVPDFTYPGGDFCMNNLISFTNTSTGETGSVVNWTWDFNGEGSSLDKDASFTFTTPGSKTIELKSSIPGCANVIQKVIYINDAPTIDFNFDNVCNAQITTFNDLTIGNNLVSWDWDFGDGNSSTDQNPTHMYTNPGQYDVTLTVTNNIGCATEQTQTVYNHNIPTVNFANDLACSSSPIQFTDQSFVQNANLAAWEWNFGDGNGSSEQNPTYLYGQTGDFTVQLKAYSEFGCVDSLESMISVIQGPEVDFTWDKSCSEATTLFTDNTNTFGNAVTERAWIIDSNLKTEQNPTYTFNSSGTYPVQYSVTLANLCAQTISQDVIVKNPPSVQFSYNEGCGNSGAVFYDLTDQTNDIITSREWRVDGQMVSTDSLYESQLTPGTYSITITVLTNSGCEESKTNNITLVGSPVADFTVNTDYGAAPLKVLFTNNSTGGSDYEWSFGDANNTTSPEINPGFTFEEIGTYTVSLKTFSGTDCFDETTHTIEVVNAETKAEILAITPIENANQNNFVITIENIGTTTLGSQNSLVFRADYGTEVIEPLNQMIYANKTINYTSSFAVPGNASMESLCVELLDESGELLDRNCKTINVSTVISKPYPNPGKSTIFIDVTLDKASSINVRILNRSGQLQLSQTYDGTEGLNPLNIDVSGLFQGLYVIEIATDTTTKQFKTTVLR